MYKNKVFSIFIIVLICQITIFSENLSDKKRAEELFSLYNSSISLKEIELILEFDKNNINALNKKAEILYSQNSNLIDIKDILDSTTFRDIESKYLYSEILYRLGSYSQLVNLDFMYEQIEDPNILYYVADSYYRLNNRVKSGEIIDIGHTKFPNDVRFMELKYLINKSRETLNVVLSSNSNLNSLIRIYDRLQTGESKKTVGYILSRTFSDLNLHDLNSYNGNYGILPIVLNTFDLNDFNGAYNIDSNNDTFIDTRITVENGVVISKSVDQDYNNIIDLDIHLEDGIPVSFTYNDIYVIYNKYPYIEKVFVNEDNGLTEFDLLKDYYTYVMKPITSDPVINFHRDTIEHLNLIEKKVYKNGEIQLRIAYNSRDSYTVFKEPSEYGFSLIENFKNDNLDFSLQDINSNGFMNIFKRYKDNKIVETQYNFDDKIDWWLH